MHTEKEIIKLGVSQVVEVMIDVQAQPTVAKQ